MRLESVKTLESTFIENIVVYGARKGKKGQERAFMDICWRVGHLTAQILELRTRLSPHTVPPEGFCKLLSLSRTAANRIHPV